LKHYCKIYEEIKKTEKEKKQKKYEKGLGEPLGPEMKRDPRPTYLHTEPVPLFLPPSLTCGPHMSSSSSSPKLPPETVSPSDYSPLQYALFPAVIDA
jgi:hypothetical protein